MFTVQLTVVASRLLASNIYFSFMSFTCEIPREYVIINAGSFALFISTKEKISEKFNSLFFNLISQPKKHWIGVYLFSLIHFLWIYYVLLQQHCAVETKKPYDIRTNNKTIERYVHTKLLFLFRPFCLYCNRVANESTLCC